MRSSSALLSARGAACAAGAPGRVSACGGKGGRRPHWATAAERRAKGANGGFRLLFVAVAASPLAVLRRLAYLLEVEVARVAGALRPLELKGGREDVLVVAAGVAEDAAAGPAVVLAPRHGELVVAVDARLGVLVVLPQRRNRRGARVELGHGRGGAEVEAGGGGAEGGEGASGVILRGGTRPTPARGRPSSGIQALAAAVARLQGAQQPRQGGCRERERGVPWGWREGRATVVEHDSKGLCGPGLLRGRVAPSVSKRHRLRVARGRAPPCLLRPR